MTTLKKRHHPDYHDKPDVTVYITPTCVNCPKTLRVLRDHQVPHTVIDVEQDAAARAYVTQDLKYKQAPIVEVHHQHEIITWTGHQPAWITEHILQWYREETEDDLYAIIDDPTLMTGNSTGPHLHFDSHAKGEQA